MAVITPKRFQESPSFYFHSVGLMSSQFKSYAVNRLLLKHRHIRFINQCDENHDGTDTSLQAL